LSLLVKMGKVEVKEYGTRCQKDQPKVFDRLRKRWPKHVENILPYLTQKPTDRDQYHVGNCTVRVFESTAVDRCVEITGRFRARVEAKGIIEKITGIKLIQRN